MIPPLNISREDFPESTRTAAGMHILQPQYDSVELQLVEDVVYTERNGQPLHLQLLLPYNPQPQPLVLFIPGSAFQKQNVKSRIPELTRLAHIGYAVALLEYRGSEVASFPSVVVDAKAGLVFLKEHAAEYHLDPERFLIMGDSSGAYTALMAGLTFQVTSLEDELSLGKDYTVRGIIDYYGPTDFTTMNEEPSTQHHLTPDSPEGLFIGRKPVDAENALVQATIIKNYLNDGRTLPPVILFHGSADELVPFSQSCELYEALIQARHTATLYQLKGSHHGGSEFWSPSMLERIHEFITTCLK